MLEAHQQQEEGVDAPLVKLSDVANLPHKITGLHICLTPQGHILLQLLWHLSEYRLSPLTLMTSSFTPLATGFISELALERIAGHHVMYLEPKALQS